MYKPYADRWPIDPEKIDSKSEGVYRTSPYVPDMYNVGLYLTNYLDYMAPFWVTGWRDESLSWHETCSIHAGLNPSPDVVIKGSDAKRFMMETFVNNSETWPIGLIKHGVICTEEGLVASHGVIMHIAEDEYEAYWHSPYLEYVFQQGDYDCELIDKTAERYVLQFQGPECLKVVEAVCDGDDLSDIEYRHFRMSTCDGNPVRIMRLGMSGSLAYEIHGRVEHCKEVFAKALRVGAPYGIRQIGTVAYQLNHVPGGMPQVGNNFQSAMFTDPGFVEFMSGIDLDQTTDFANAADPERLYTGSAGSDERIRMFNPMEFGLGHVINWKHDFRGKAALEEYKANRKRQLVTLKWNAEDLVDIYISQFQEGEPYRQFDWPCAEFTDGEGSFMLNADKVLDEQGNEVGISLGATNDVYDHAMLSFASIDIAFAEQGTQVYVLWGNPGQRQKKVRAEVVPTPYNQHLTNEGTVASATK